MIGATYQQAAAAYAAAGVVPLPIARDGKHPLVKHPGKFGQRAALQIVGKFPDANVGFWCGRHNKLTVVDIDSTADAELQHALDTFGDSPVIVRTASGKAHIYYRHDGERRRIRPDKEHHIDILGSGPCVAPPSIRPAGGAYHFERGSLGDFPNLPKIRPGAVPRLDPEPVAVARKTVVPGAVSIGGRNDALFRLALGMAHDANSLAEMIDRARKANADLSNPPLPDAEVQRAARSAWQYRQEGRLMVPGATRPSLILPTSALDHAMATGNLDVLALVGMVQKYHSQPGKMFALSPAALEAAQKIGSWNKRRYRNAISKACDLGELVQVHKGGKGKRDPDMYRLPLLLKGGRFGSQS